LMVLSTTVSTPERAQQEIVLQTTLARALLTTKGFTKEVEQAYERALELCDNADEIPQLFMVLRGLASFYEMIAENEKGLQIGQRIMELAEHLDDEDMRIEAHLVLAENIMGNDVQTGLDHLEKVIAVIGPDGSHMQRLGISSNSGVVALNVSAILLWMSGFPDQASKRSTQAVALAQKLDHPFSKSYALFHYSILNLWMGNLQAVQSGTRTLIDLATEYDFQIWSAVASMLSGAAMVFKGQIDAGIALIEPAMTVYRGLKTPPVFLPLLFSIQAGAYNLAGRPADGLHLINEAIQIGSAQSGKIFVPDIMGLKGELLLALDSGNAAEAEALFQLAVDIAREVKLPMIELRAAIRLSRLWQNQNKIQPARALLHNSYAKMTEGFGTRDMKQARMLLEQLDQSDAKNG
jgi:tetratricopeptide (TPR) repeat protein